MNFRKATYFKQHLIFKTPGKCIEQSHQHHLNPINCDITLETHVRAHVRSLQKYYFFFQKFEIITDYMFAMNLYVHKVLRCQSIAIIVTFSCSSLLLSHSDVSIACSSFLKHFCAASFLSLFPSPSRVSSQIETPWCESPDWGHLNHAAHGPASKCGQESPVTSVTDSRDSRGQRHRHVGHGQSWACAIGHEPHWASAN